MTNARPRGLRIWYNSILSLWYPVDTSVLPKPRTFHSNADEIPAHRMSVMGFERGGGVHSPPYPPPPPTGLFRVTLHSSPLLYPLPHATFPHSYWNIHSFSGLMNSGKVLPQYCTVLDPALWVKLCTVLQFICTDGTALFLTKDVLAFH